MHALKDHYIKKGTVPPVLENRPSVSENVNEMLRWGFDQFADGIALGGEAFLVFGHNVSFI